MFLLHILYHLSACEVRSCFDHLAKPLEKSLEFLSRSASHCLWSPIDSMSVNINSIRLCVSQVLDAPELGDDFYLNLVDWSSLNILSVGLGTCVYLWSACTSQVTRLCDLSGDSNSVTSVAWNERVCFLPSFFENNVLLLHLG